MTVLLAVINTILGIIAAVCKQRYSPEAIKKRREVERDKEFIDSDNMAISKRLFDNFRRLRRKKE